MVLEEDQTISYASLSAKRVLGRRPEELVGSSATEYLHTEAASWDRPPTPFLGSEDANALCSFRVRHADGSWRHLEAIIVDLSDSAGTRKAYYMRDITHRKVLEENLARRALQDPLTGLANRRLFMDRLAHALTGTVRRQSCTAVLFMDLDNFKAVNDSLGHEAGDELLVAVGRRLQGCLRPGDTLARFGGDEFTVLLEEVTDVGDAVRLAERVLEVLQTPVVLGSHKLYVSVSIGVAASGPNLDRAESLLRAADVAMYRSKETGKSTYKVFEDGMTVKVIERMELENGLRKAVDRGELRVYYQPQMLMESRKIVGMEALLRWDYPPRGLVPPEEFITLLEQTDLIVPIGQYVLEEACRQAKEWHELYPDDRISMGVNLSARQFRQPDLKEKVAGVLRKTGLDPHALVLEITESVLMDDTQHAANILQGLKGLGVRFAIDDFGTGYSSLSYLQRFPIDYLKVDRSFVGSLGKGRNNARALIGALMSFTRALGIEAVAEGVETAEQLDELRGMQCEFGQGYYFSEPLSGRAASDLLAFTHPRPTAGAGSAGRRRKVRVLVTNEHRSYSEVLVEVFREQRPNTEVFGTDQVYLDREVVRLEPDLVVCSRITPVVSSRVPVWVELYPEGQPLTRVSIAGQLSTSTDVELSYLLGIIDETEELLRSGGGRGP